MRGHPNFLHDNPRMSRLNWLWLAAGTAAMAGALMFQHAVELEEQKAESSAQRLRDAASLLNRPAGKTSTEDVRVAERNRHVQATLKSPWLATLQAVETATVPPVYLLSLNVDSATGAIRLEAEAPDYPQALAYVHALSRSGALEPAMIEAHEQIESLEPARAKLRFRISTRWRVGHTP